MPSPLNRQYPDRWRDDRTADDRRSRQAPAVLALGSLPVECDLALHAELRHRLRGAVTVHRLNVEGPRHPTALELARERRPGLEATVGVRVVLVADVLVSGGRGDGDRKDAGPFPAGLAGVGVLGAVSAVVSGLARTGWLAAVDGAVAARGAGLPVCHD